MTVSGKDDFAGQKDKGPLWNLARSAEFWGRACAIYGSYKITQVKALAFKLQGNQGADGLKELWNSQHCWAGDQMYDLAISLRGFYLKAGQFIGARADFVPEQICRRLTRLQDRVPPMPSERAAAVLSAELGVTDLGEVFDWIDLEEPLGSASISQVHKAQLRRYSRQQLKRLARRERGLLRSVVVGAGESAWDVCNAAGISLGELAAANKGLDLEELTPGQVLQLPVVLGLGEFQGSGGGGSGGGSGSSGGWGLLFWRRGRRGGDGGGSATDGRSNGALSSNGSSSKGGSSDDLVFHSGAAAAVAHAVAAGVAPADGLVAVKIQYPDALAVMSTDLVNLRAISAFLSKTEIKFDLVSAVDELRKQIKLEFEFLREARVMDTIAHHLRHMSSRVAVPRSVPGLVTQRVMVMQYMDGVPLMQLRDKVAHLPAWQREKAAQRILSHLSEAYGTMILGEGLFQADGHPGNILVQEGGRIALLDYGQSKQLARRERKGLAHLVLALDRGDANEISATMAELGVVTSKDDADVRAEMAYGMFDTRGKVDPFKPDSPIKKASISTFPPDLFFVLRVVQLLRGMATAMGVTDFSSAHQWAPLARRALRDLEWQERGRAQRRRVPELAEVVSPLMLTV